MIAEIPPRRLRRTRNVLIRAAVVLAGCTIVLLIQPDPLGFIDVLKSSVTMASLVPIPFVLSAHVFNAIRYGLLAGPPTPPLSVAIGAVIVGSAGNFVLPGRGGEALRATYLREHGHIPMVHALTAVVVGRACDLVLVGILALWLLAATTLPIGPAPAIFAALAALTGLVAVTFLGARYAQRTRPHAAWRLAALSSLRHARAMVTTGRFALALPFGLLTWATNFLGTWAFIAMQPNMLLGAREVATMFVATAAATAIPVLPGGLGLYQAAAVLVLVHFGVGFDVALALSLVLHLTQMMPTLLIAMVLATTTHTGLRSALADLIRVVTGERKAKS